MPTSPPSPVYLVELSEPHSGELESADITLYLENAVEQVFLHLTSFGEALRVEVRRDRHGHLEGIGFLTRDGGDLLSSITVYHLDRDRLEAVTPGVVEAACARSSDLERSLNALFKR